MKKKNPHAVSLGALGGKSRSKAKAEAARKNGLKARKRIAPNCPKCGPSVVVMLWPRARSLPRWKCVECGYRFDVVKKKGNKALKKATK